MKRIVCILSAAALLSSSVALADPMTIDLDGMTPKEIKELISMAEDEYKEATDISSSDAKLLTENFKSAFESLIQKDADVSYPLFGLDKQRARTMYKLSGDCTVKFADKTKSTYSMTMIYWHEEATKTFHQVAFYSKEKIYYCDHDLLSNVAPYLSDSVLERLGADEIVYTATSAMETPVPTATPEVTPVPTATPTPEPTPEITPVPTAATQEAYIENALKSALESQFIRFENNNYGKNINVYDPLFSILKKDLENRPRKYLAVKECGDPILSEGGFRGQWETLMRRLTNVNSGYPAHLHIKRTDEQKAEFLSTLKPVSFTPHDLRYTFATILFNAGVDEKSACKIMGHTDVRMTRDLYAQLTAEQNAKSDKRLEEYLMKYSSVTEVLTNDSES